MWLCVLGKAMLWSQSKDSLGLSFPFCNTKGGTDVFCLMLTFCRTQAGLDTSVALLEVSLSESQGVNVTAEALCPTGSFRTRFPKGTSS